MKSDCRIRVSGHCFNLLADVAETIGRDGCTENIILAMLREHRWDNERDPAEIMPENMTPREFIDEMSQSGIVHSESRRIIIPIPSFRQYLINGRLDTI